MFSPGTAALPHFFHCTLKAGIGAVCWLTDPLTVVDRPHAHLVGSAKGSSEAEEATAALLDEKKEGGRLAARRSL